LNPAINRINLRVWEEYKQVFMERLPDDLWLQIFKIGIENHILDHTNICSLAMTCHHFDQITQQPDLWAALLDQNFLSSTVLSDQHASKALFKTELK
jgi:F-box-like